MANSEWADHCDLTAAVDSLDIWKGWANTALAINSLLAMTFYPSNISQLMDSLVSCRPEVVEHAANNGEVAEVR